MDPLSITTGCLGLLSAIANTTIAISGFIKGCREARSDLTAVSRELSDLTIVLELLRDDSEAFENGSIPEAMAIQIMSLLTSCNAVVIAVNKVIERHTGRLGPIKWVADGKKEITYLRHSLEAYRGTLSLALDTVNLSLTKAARNDTSAIKSNTSDIKQDTAQILAEIARLRTLIPQEQRENLILDRYLDSISKYAETVFDEAVRDGSIDQDRNSVTSLEADKVDNTLDDSLQPDQTELPPLPSKSRLRVLNSQMSKGGDDVTNALRYPVGEAPVSLEDLVHRERLESTDDLLELSETQSSSVVSLELPDRGGSLPSRSIRNRAGVKAFTPSFPAKSGKLAGPIRHMTSIPAELEPKQIALSSDGTVVAGYRGLDVYVWSISSGKSLGKFNTKHQSFLDTFKDSRSRSVKKVAIVSTRYNIVAVQIKDNLVELWDWTRSPTKAIWAQKWANPTWACFSKDQLLAFLTGDGLYEYEYVQGPKRVALRSSVSEVQQAPTWRIDYRTDIISYSQNAGTIIGARRSGFMQVYDRVTGLVKTRTTDTVYDRFPVAIASNERTVVSAWSNTMSYKSDRWIDKILLWEIGPNTTRIVSVDGYFSALSPDGSYLVHGTVNSANEDNCLHVVESATGRTIWTEPGVQGHGCAIAQGDEKYVIASTGNLRQEMATDKPKKGEDLSFTNRGIEIYQQE